MIWTRVCKTGADLLSEVERVIVDAESRGWRSVVPVV